MLAFYSRTESRGLGCKGVHAGATYCTVMGELWGLGGRESYLGCVKFEKCSRYPFPLVRQKSDTHSNWSLEECWAEGLLEESGQGDQPVVGKLPGWGTAPGLTGQGEEERAYQKPERIMAAGEQAKQKTREYLLELLPSDFPIWCQCLLLGNTAWWCFTLHITVGLAGHRTDGQAASTTCKWR